MNKIQQVIGALENEKDWCGMDVSLDISLFEYGIIWKIEGDKVKFIFSVAEEGDSRAVIRETVYDLNTDPKKEWGWALKDSDNEGFYSYLGMTRAKFLKIPFTHQVYFLFRYYGEYEIFGTDCPSRVIEFKD